MWFRVLSLVIAAALVAKATIALSARQWFYAKRQRQYATESLPTKLLVAPAVVITLTIVAWYATIFHYQPWSWVVTGFLTALSCMGVDHVFRWSMHRQAMLAVVTNPKVWQVDCLLLVVGSGFVALALLVY
jgi:hypothetical protein